MNFPFYRVYAVAFALMLPSISALAQQAAATPSPLAALISEAQSSNTQIAAADHAWRAARAVKAQVTTLPDPQLTLQSFSVGSPKPFAGFSNSDFAYLGIGASQDIPFAGKLRLKGEVADREANRQQTQTDLLRSSITEQVKTLYLQIAHANATLAILDQNAAILQPLIESALSRYSLGQGTQAEVLRAQIEHTKLLRERTKQQQELGQLQASLKELLHRPQSSIDIVPEPLALTPLEQSAEDLQGLVMAHNPAVFAKSADVAKQDAELKSAQRESKPDFNIGYMFQQTGGGYRDYYMLTLNMRLPRHGRVEAGITEAAESLARSRQQLDSQVQQQLAEVQKQYVAVTSTSELIAEYRDGLLPQSQAAFHAEETSYRSGEQAFAPVLTTLLDVLSFEQDYQQALLDHETALARLETLTGAQLR